MQEDIKGALKKCALGFDTSEVVEEFTVEDGELKLLKKKVIKRDIPPDIKAVKMLMEGCQISTLTDDELEEERAKLYELLKKY